MKTLKSTLAAGLIGLVVLSVPTGTLAQETPSLTAEAVTDEQISAFVRAAIALEDVRKEYTARIAAAKSDEERTALATEADSTAKTLVEKVKGITPDEYLILSRLSVEDESVTERVTAEIGRMRELKAEYEAKQAQQATTAGQLKFSEPTTTEEPATE